MITVFINIAHNSFDRHLSFVITMSIYVLSYVSLSIYLIVRGMRWIEQREKKVRLITIVCGAVLVVSLIIFIGFFLGACLVAIFLIGM